MSFEPTSDEQAADDPTNVNPACRSKIESIEEGPFDPAANSSPQPLSLGGMLAWLVIVLMTGGILAFVLAGSQQTEKEMAPDFSAAELAQFELQGKLQIAMQQMTREATKSATQNDTKIDSDDEAVKPDAKNDSQEPSADGIKPADEAEHSKPFTVNAELPIPSELDVGPYAQRLCYTILINELKGPEQALKHLETTDERLADVKLNLTDEQGTPLKFKLTDEQQQLRTSLRTLLTHYANGDFSGDLLTAPEQELLKQKLGWYGKLVLAPKGAKDDSQRNQVIAEATSSLFRIAGAMFFGMLAAGVGVLVVIALIVLLSIGKLYPRFRHQTGRHNIYIETFAIWMVIFFAGQIPFGLLMSLLGVVDEMSQVKGSLLLVFGSLISLAWPVIRGIPFREVRQDIGWTFGNPIIEGGIGVLSYVAALPALAVAVGVVIGLLVTFGPKQSPTDFSNHGGPSHPVQEYLAEGNLAVFGLVLVLACVAAPIVEETMFRGVFYRHLRDLSAGCQRWISIAIACLINSFVFASIHPQGLFGIPLLMTLAVAFSLVREWRGSLLAPVLMHALSNFLVTTLAFFLM